MSKVAAIQLTSTKNIDENLEKSKKLISEASINGAQLIVPPEMFAIMGDLPPINWSNLLGEGQ